MRVPYFHPYIEKYELFFWFTLRIIKIRERIVFKRHHFFFVERTSVYHVWNIFSFSVHRIEVRKIVSKVLLRIYCLANDRHDIHEIICFFFYRFYVNARNMSHINHLVRIFFKHFFMSCYNFKRISVYKIFTGTCSKKKMAFLWSKWFLLLWRKCFKN